MLVEEEEEIKSFSERLWPSLEWSKEQKWFHFHSTEAWVGAGGGCYENEARTRDKMV